MAQPTPYVPSFDFSDFSTLNPDTPQPGVSLDAQFNAIALTLNEILTNLALIQRDDGALANGIVTSESLAAGITIGVEPATTWVTATEYEASVNLVWQSGKLYQCLVDHTSGTFATDLAAGKWVEIFDLASEVPGVTGVFARQMVTLNTAGSPYTLVEADMNGTVYLVDTSAGNVTVNLPDSSGLVDDGFCRAKFIRTSASNVFTIARAGSDTINGATSLVGLAALYTHIDLFAGGGTTWQAVTYNVPIDNTVSAAKIQSDAVTTIKILDANVTTAKLADANVTTPKVGLVQGGDVSSGSGTTTLDMSAHSYRKVTATGNITIDITPTTSRPGGFVLEAVNFGAHTITWTGVDDWADGAAPTLTASGTDMLGFICDDDGRVVGYVIALAVA
jgi:hypothetical protein